MSDPKRYTTDEVALGFCNAAAELFERLPAEIKAAKPDDHAKFCRLLAEGWRPAIACIMDQTEGRLTVELAVRSDLDETAVVWKLSRTAADGEIEGVFHRIVDGT